MTAKLSDSERLLRTITEAKFQRTVEQILTATGWRWYHPPDNRPTRSTGFIQGIRAGYPDLTAVRGARVLWAELKKQGPAGVVSAEQQQWHEDLRAAGMEVYVWRPSDLPAIHEVLAPAWRPRANSTHSK